MSLLSVQTRLWTSLWVRRGWDVGTAGTAGGEVLNNLCVRSGERASRLWVVWGPVVDKRVTAGGYAGEGWVWPCGPPSPGGNNLWMRRGQVASGGGQSAGQTIRVGRCCGVALQGGRVARLQRPGESGLTGPVATSSGGDRAHPDQAALGTQARHVQGLDRRHLAVRWQRGPFGLGARPLHRHPDTAGRQPVTGEGDEVGQ